MPSPVATPDELAGAAITRIIVAVKIIVVMINEKMALKGNPVLLKDVLINIGSVLMLLSLLVNDLP
ncbi:MAG: hypothetical protein HZB44_01155 [Actinobacteria bacterium]|nr:hypothetical protein [Actinomycetota bacterium]